MAIRKKDGILKTNKGDSFTLTFNIKNLMPVTLYSIYLSLNFDVPVIKQVEATTDQEGFYKAVFEVSRDETEVLTKRYTYGVKACRDGREDTIHTGTIEIEPKYVEGA